MLLLLRQVPLAEYQIRPATARDAPAIRSLIHDVQINPTGLSWRHFLVAVTVQGELLGCGQVKPHSDGSRELASIAVQEKARKQGIASSMIRTLLAQEQARPLYLICRSRLESFYNKFGFHAILLDDMPPYFKRIYRLVGMFRSNSQHEDRLMVMRLD